MIVPKFPGSFIASKAKISPFSFKLVTSGNWKIANTLLGVFNLLIFFSSFSETAITLFFSTAQIKSSVQKSK